MIFLIKKLFARILKLFCWFKFLGRVEIPTFSRQNSITFDRGVRFWRFFKMQVISEAFRMAMIGFRELESELRGFLGGLIDTSWNSWHFEQKWIFVFWSLIFVMTQRSKHLETVLPPLVQQFKKTQEKKKCNFYWFWSETTKFSKNKWSHQKRQKIISKKYFSGGLYGKI